MIAKCFAIVVIACQLKFAICNSDCTTQPPCGTTPFVVSTPGVVVNRGVAKGRFPVALKNCGAAPDRKIPVTTARFSAPVVEKPTIRLPYNIPAPRVISHTCTCYKTLVRPHVQQVLISVPVIQRYIQTGHKPVVENIQYEAVVTGCSESDPPVQKYDVVEPNQPAVQQVVPVSLPAPTVAAPQFPVFVGSAQPFQLTKISNGEPAQYEKVEAPSGIEFSKCYPC